MSLTMPVTVLGNLMMLAGLAIAARWDQAKRVIPNAAVLVVAVGGMVTWFAMPPGESIWARIAAGAAVFVILRLLSAIELVGGGDVKLITAVVLGIRLSAVLPVLAIISIAGGLLAGWQLVRQGTMRRPVKQPAVAFAAGGEKSVHPVADQCALVFADLKVEIPYGPAVLVGVVTYQMWETLKCLSANCFSS